MSEFSRQLTCYIKKCGINISKLSSDTGIDRTLLHKYISGRRIPGDIHVINAICSRLLISDEDILKLTESYKLSYFGSEIYSQQKKAAMIIETLSKASSITIPQKPSVRRRQNTGSIKVINGEHSVKAAIRNILSGTENHIFILSSSCKNIADEVASLCADGFYPHIDHIIALCAGNIQGHTLYNISTLLDILPAVIYDDNYICSYFYSNPEAVFQNSGLLPDMIISDQCIMRFADDLSCAVMDINKDTLELYHRLAAARVTSSQIFVQKKPVLRCEKRETGRIINENVSVIPEEKNNILYYSMNKKLYRIKINETEINAMFDPESMSF